MVTPQYKSQHSESAQRASYGSTQGQNGYPVQVGAPPSLAQLQRHMMGTSGKDNTRDRDVEAGDTGGDASDSDIVREAVNKNIP